MKKFLLPLFCILFIFNSCKKKTDVLPVNTISATVGGTAMNFNSKVQALYSINNETGGTVLWITGYTGTDNLAGSMAISIAASDKSSFKVGTYNISSISNQAPVFIELIYGSGDPSINPSQQPWLSDTNAVQPATITITSVSGTNMQGTFSGVLLHWFGSDNKTVANGKFNVNTL
ncbi:MAG: hypothetical protein ACXVI9_08435 [Mucilaginibacter sp.]